MVKKDDLLKLTKPLHSHSDDNSISRFYVKIKDLFLADSCVFFRFYWRHRKFFKL